MKKKLIYILICILIIIVVALNGCGPLDNSSTKKTETEYITLTFEFDDKPTEKYYLQKGSLFSELSESTELLRKNKWYYMWEYTAYTQKGYTWIKETRKKERELNINSRLDIDQTFYTKQNQDKNFLKNE